jgi:two-component system sensor histidine kinase DesK
MTAPGADTGAASRPRRLALMAFGLCYLAFPVLEIVLGRLTGVRAVWAGAALVAFVAAYLATALGPPTFGQPVRWTYPLLALTTVLGLVPAAVFGGVWLALPVFTVVLYGMILPTRAAAVAVAAMLVAEAACGVISGTDAAGIGIYALQVVTIGLLFMRVRRTGVLARQLREAQGEVGRLAAADERLRIARDLHDLLGHSLSVIVLKAELAGRLAEDSPRVRQELGDIESVARKALAEVREAVTGYRRRSLAEELDGARAVLRAAGVETRVRRPDAPLPPHVDALLAYAVREGATNVVRHAAARRCTIEVTYENTYGKRTGEKRTGGKATGGSATLEIVDDGRGGEPGGTGSGLAGLAERVRDAGGTLEARPGQKAGFRLRVRVPVHEEDAA